MSISVYGNNPWGKNKTDQHQVKTILLKSIRRILKISWSQKLIKEEVRRRDGRKAISTKIKWEEGGKKWRRHQYNSKTKTVSWLPIVYRRNPHSELFESYFSYLNDHAFEVVMSNVRNEENRKSPTFIAYTLSVSSMDQQRLLSQAPPRSPVSLQCQFLYLLP